MNVEDQPRYEYRLTFAQAFCSPTAQFIFRCGAIALTCFQIYQTAFSGQENHTAYLVGWVIAFFLSLVSLPNLFFGTQPWNALRWIEFRDRGIASNYEPYNSVYKLNDQPIELRTIPYRALVVRKYMPGLLMLHAPTHGNAFAMIPEKVISKSALERRIGEGSEHARTLPEEDIALKRAMIQAKVLLVLKSYAPKREIRTDMKIMNDLITDGDDATEAIMHLQGMTGARPPMKEWDNVLTVDQMIELLVKYAP